MLAFGIAYLAASVAFLLLDFAWLTFATQRLYRPLLGTLLSPSPNLPVAGVFYATYLIGVVVFAVMPGYAARSPIVALGLGALLGLVAYGTYDLTNLSTLRGWPTSVSMIDLAWGTAVTAAASLAGFLGVRAVYGG